MFYIDNFIKVSGKNVKKSAKLNMWLEIYTFLILYFVFLFFILIYNGGDHTLVNTVSLISFLMLVFFILFLNYNRDIVSDSLVYQDYFNQLKLLDFKGVLEFDSRFMIGFKIWTWLNSQLYDSVRFYFGLTAVLIYLLTFISLKLSLGLKYSLIAIICYSMYPWFALYSASGLRQGIALAIFLLSVGYLIKGESKFSLIFLVVSFLFHKSSIIFAPIFILMIIGISLRNVYFIYFVCIIISLFGFNEIFREYGSIFGDDVKSYFSGEAEGYIVGFRLDFLVFSISPLVVFHYFRYLYGRFSIKIEQLIKFYILANCYMLILSFVPFYDRIAAYSWYLIPMFIVFLCKEINSNLSKFTLVLGLSIINLLAFRFYNWNWYFYYG
ncbi:EpsG family protein [Vibrio kanaloae]|nr:EpsG family protein [Vibrio kanaloae]